jgi:hypothetical protein
MSRSLWFVAGAGAGVYAMTKVRRTAEVLTADGLADRLAGLSVAAHLFRSEVRAGMAEKENDLRGRLGLALHSDQTRDHTPPGLPAGASADAGTGSGSDTREGND